MKVVWRQKALDDLEKLASFAPAQASAVYSAVVWLSRGPFSRLGRSVGGQIQYWAVPPQGIFYEVSANALYVLAIRDARRGESNRPTMTPNVTSINSTPGGAEDISCRVVTACRICGGGDLVPFLSLGDQPHCNSFLRADQLNQPEPRWPLALLFCNGCHLVQLTHVVDPDIMFRNYVYVSGTTASLSAHFKASAQELVQRLDLQRGDLVVDIGSNDGTWLSHFKDLGMTTVGVDPATNIAAMANDAGIETVNDYFGVRSAAGVAAKHGQAALITAAGVFFHIDDMDDVCRGITQLLRPDGVLHIEAIYLGDMLAQRSFDNVYHEHVSYYTLAPLQRLLERFDLEVFNVGHADIHGGVLLVDAGHPGAHQIDGSVEALLSEEKRRGLDTLVPYEEFAHAVAHIRDDLRALVGNLQAQGRSVWAYGAPAKGNTLLNYCGFGPETLPCAVEKAPLKVGLYTPGTHIPVVAEDEVDAPPDYYLLLPWNFADELLRKNAPYRDAGGKFIVPIPSPHVV